MQATLTIPLLTPWEQIKKPSRTASLNLVAYIGIQKNACWKKSLPGLLMTCQLLSLLLASSMCNIQDGGWSIGKMKPCKGSGPPKIVVEMLKNSILWTTWSAYFLPIWQLNSLIAETVYQSCNLQKVGQCHRKGVITKAWSSQNVV